MSWRAEAVLGGVRVGGEHPVAVMGALNVSPESFYGDSIHRDQDALVRAGAAMARAGAAILDVGARSTAPYLDTSIDEREEADRLAAAVHALTTKIGLPVSADTARAAVARAALDAGAVIINDVTALADPGLAQLVPARRAAVILMASPAARARRGDGASERPVSAVDAILGAALQRARDADIPDEHVVLDPGIGFFRDQAVSWDAWDVDVLAHLHVLARCGRPLCVGVSRKSFLGAITGQADPASRLPASLAAAAIAVLGGAAIVRAHDVAETIDAVRVAERVRAVRASAGARE